MGNLKMADAVRVSGLTKYQIDQFISRYGFAPYGKAHIGAAREFHPADVFDLVLAGQLHRMGFSQPTVRDFLAVQPFRSEGPDGAPAELFAGEGISGEPKFIVAIAGGEDGFEEANIVYGSQIGTWLTAKGAEGAVVINASAIADLVRKMVA